MARPIRPLRTTRILSALLLAFPSLGSAQRSGRVEGVVLDSATSTPLANVGIQLVGTTLGALTGADGRFVIPQVAEGPVTLQLRRLGYSPRTLTGLFLTAGTTLEQRVTLSPVTLTLAATLVTAAAERGSVSDALDAQRLARGVTNAITAEQMSKSADGDAAQAMQRVSGVTVTGGRYVFVRGLGERYTTAQLNGARIPSPEPEKRVVPLDLFPTGLLQSVTAQKTYTPDLQGDFSGAVVDIQTREAPLRRRVTYAATVGANASALGTSLPTAFTVGGERLALVSLDRKLPAALRNFSDQGFPALNDGDKRSLVSAMRNPWQGTLRSPAGNLSNAASLGGQEAILGHRIGYLFSGTFAQAVEAKLDQRRALANRGSTPGSTVTLDPFAGSSSSSSVLWGGLANLNSVFGGHTRLYMNNTLSRTSDNESRRERGSFESDGINVQIDKNQYVARTVRSHQLGAEHTVGRQRVDWALSLARVARDEPDRSEFVSVIEGGNGEPETSRWLSTGNGGAVRTFSELDERSHEGRANYQLSLGSKSQHLLKVGALFRRTSRDASSFAFSVSAPRMTLTERALGPSEIFDGRFADRANFWEIVALSQGGSYAASDRLAAGFAMIDAAIGNRVRLIAGARFESDSVRVSTQSTLGTPVVVGRRWNDLLPSAVANITLNQAQTLRLSLTRTLARPEYRELSPVTSRDVLNADDSQGNPNLSRTRIVNADLRWEWYPNADEVLTIGLFAKRFDQPIERAYRAGNSANRTLVYVNADAATTYGWELDARKSLGVLGSAFRPFTAFGNVTVMTSQIDLGAQQLAATNAKRRMVGQAPYVVNGGLSYASASGALSATALVSRTGSRIEAAGDQPLPDVVLQPRTMLDATVRFPVVRQLTGRFDLRNLLNAPYRVTQGTVVREAFQQGRIAQFGFQWAP